MIDPPSRNHNISKFLLTFYDYRAAVLAETTYLRTKKNSGLSYLTLANPSPSWSKPPKRALPPRRSAKKRASLSSQSRMKGAPSARLETSIRRRATVSSFQGTERIVPVSLTKHARTLRRRRDCVSLSSWRRRRRALRRRI